MARFFHRAVAVAANEHEERPSAIEETPSQGADEPRGNDGDRVPPREEAPWWRLHLWQLEPVRDALVLLGVAILLWLALQLSAVTLPALLAFSLAYLFDPLVSRAKEKAGLPRWVSTLLLVLVVGTLLGGAGTWLLPRVVEDGREMVRDIPPLLQGAVDWLDERGVLPAEVEEALSEGPAVPSSAVLGSAKSFFGTMTALLSSTIVGLVIATYTLVLFVYFSIRFPRLPSVGRMLPASRRDQILRVLSRFERAFGGFLRGQIIVALFTTTVFALGFSLVGVPHAPLAAFIGGALSFIPNGQVSGLLTAWLFGIIESGSGLEVLPVFVYPAAVYAVSQSLETFVVTPIVQGRQTRMHPLIVLSALIAGAAVGGVLGIFLAIPITACAKILLAEVIVPEFERFAARS